MLEKVLKWGIYTGLFAIPFVVLIVADNQFFPFITGKNFTFRIIVEIVFGLWACLALLSAAYRPRWSLALMIGAAFVVSLGISTLLAENPIKAFWSNFERMEGYVTILHLAMYVTVLTAMLRTEELWRKFFLTTIGVSVLVGLYGLYQISGLAAINQGGLRVDGTLGNATYLAVYMLIHAFLAVLLLAKWARTRTQQILLSLALILQIAMIFYSATRGTILGLIGGAALSGLIIAFSKGTAPAIRKVGIGLIVGVVVLVGAFIAVKDTSFVQNHPILTRIASISVEAGNTRFQIWGMAWQGFMERPIFGWGQEGFNLVFNKYYYAGLYNQEPWFDRAHNVFLDWLIAGGVFGLVLYLALFGAALYYIWKPGVFDTIERAILTGLLAGYFFHNIFVFDNLMSYMLFAALLSYVTVRAVPPRQWGGELPQEPRYIAQGVVVVATICMLYFLNAPGIASARGLIEGLRSHTAEEGGVATNIAYMKQAAERGGLGSQEANEQLLLFVEQVFRSNVGSEAERTDLAGYGKVQFQKELAHSPHDARLLIFLGSYLKNFGDYAGARTALEAALAESPQKQAIYFELGSLENAAGNNAAGLEWFKKAFDLEPAFDQARILYASAAIVAGQKDLANSLLKERYGTVIPADGSLMRAYLQAGDFASAVGIAVARRDQAVEQKSVDTQVWVELVQIYVQVGQKANALKTLDEAIAYLPAYTDNWTAIKAQVSAGE